MSNLISLFSSLISRFATSGVDLTSEKLVGIAQGLIFAILFFIIFAVLYLHFTRDDSQLRQLFYITVALLGMVVLAKYSIFHFYQDYIPDRLLLYALPSPKAEGIWFWLSSVIFILFLYFREKIEGLSTGKFLLLLWLIFVIFSLSVAASREGVYSIYERFTRTYWEYTGNVHLVKSIPDFLHNFAALNIQLASHTSTHPPGFTLLLYIFQRFFQVSYLGWSILVVLFGSLTIFPLYFFLRYSVDDYVTRRALQLFIFLPSFVILGATSMDVTFVTVVWLAFALAAIGWQENFWLALAGGVSAALALFMNFLFLLLGPVFLYWLYIFYRQTTNKKLWILRVTGSLIGLVGFYLVLFWFTGYSIIGNFRISQAIQHTVAESNFVSFAKYWLYFVMNILPFVFYLGIANLVPLSRRLQRILSTQDRQLFVIGLALVTFFLFIGIFQGETERIWLFITPWFVVPFALASKEFSSRQFSALLALSFLQIIITQTFFYTYW